MNEVETRYALINPILWDMGVLSEATKRIWLEPSMLYHQNIARLDAFLDALGTNRPTNRVAAHFTQAIISKMNFLPSAAHAIAGLVRLRRTQIRAFGIYSATALKN